MIHDHFEKKRRRGSLVAGSRSPFMATAVVSILLFAAVGSCTVVVEEPCDPNGSNGLPGGGVPTVDMLVMIDLQRGSAQLATLYEALIEGLEFALTERDVALRQIGLAPLHHRSGTNVPLIHGTQAESPFSSMTEAILYYATEGASLLSESPGGELDNLAAIGTNLNQKAIHDPFAQAPLPTPYFLEPADGLIVLVISANERRCASNEPACQIEGLNPADHFTREDDNGARWLNMPGGSLPANRIFHLALVTSEIDDFDRFASECLSKPNFPQGVIDAMQPGGTPFYGPFVQDVRSNGGRGGMEDLCSVLSTSAPIHLFRLAQDIRNMF